MLVPCPTVLHTNTEGTYSPLSRLGLGSGADVLQMRHADLAGCWRFIEREIVAENT